MSFFYGVHHSALEKEEKYQNSYHGVFIDKQVKRTVAGLSHISIIAKFDLVNGSTSLDVLDACIGYVSQNTKVTLEIPFEESYVLENVFNEAMSVEYDLALLPPKNLTTENINEYKIRLQSAMTLWLRKKQNKQMIYPVSNYFSYMVGDITGFSRTSITDDPYVDHLFVKPFDLDQMDYIKDGLYDAAIDSFGGKNQLEIFCHSLIKSVVEKLNKTNEA